MKIKNADDIYAEIEALLPARWAPGPEVQFLMRVIAIQMAQMNAELLAALEKMGVPSAEDVAGIMLKELASGKLFQVTEREKDAD